MCFSFFFQAEDGIRDGHVTGVQTCALPIFPGYQGLRYDTGEYNYDHDAYINAIELYKEISDNGWLLPGTNNFQIPDAREIGRASCRERVERAGGDGGVTRTGGEGAEGHERA